MFESRGGPDEPIEFKALNRTTSRVSQDAGIIERATARSIRRSAAKVFNELPTPLTGVGINPAVGSALGHSGVSFLASVTEGYTGRLSVNNLKQKVAAPKSPDTQLFDTRLGPAYPRRSSHRQSLIYVNKSVILTVTRRVLSFAARISLLGTTHTRIILPLLRRMYASATDFHLKSHHRAPARSPYGNR